MLRVAILAVTFAAAGILALGPVAAASGPMADAGLDQTVTVETTVHLDGTGSGHPDGTLSEYEWTIRTPDGREIEPDCPRCARSQFTPSVVGRYAVTLTVTGPSGARSTDTLYVYVKDAGPDVDLSGDRTPDPDESVTYTATAESPDAELEEIAWAVEDEIVAVQSLDGSTDESELSLAFTDAETHRVQVVVRDSNGRTAYDQLYVQPQSESVEPTSWSEVEPLDCSDSGYAARNSEKCWDIEVPQTTPEEEVASSTRDSDVGPFEIRFQTDGYVSSRFVGLRNVDSSYIGSTINSVGLDDGENAPWNRGILERTYETTIGAGARLLFGQEQKTVTCEIKGGDFVGRGCAERVFALERTGETTNVHSPTKSASYSEYGLNGGRRVRGVNPLTLEEGQKAEVTIVIQQKKDGLVDEVIEGVDSSADKVRQNVNGFLGGEESPEPEADDHEVSSESSQRDPDLIAGSATRGAIASGDGSYANSVTGTEDNDSYSSSSREPDYSQSGGTHDSSYNRNRGGLVA